SRHNAYYNLGITEENCGNWLTAKEYFEKTLEIVDPYLDCYSRIGWMSIQLENHSAAAIWFDKQIRNKPSELSACIGMAEALMCQDDSLGAEAVLRSGLNTVDRAEKVYERLLRLFNNTEQWEKTVSLSDTALKKFPQDSVLYLRKAEAKLMLRNYTEAIKCFNQAEGLGESSIDQSLGFANACFMLEQNTEAVKHYRKALEYDKHSAIIHRNIGIALARTGELEESIKFLKSYTEIAPEDTSILMILGAAYYKNNDIRQAIVIYENMLRDNPEDRDALLAISDCYLKLGSSESALLGYQRLIKSNPSDKDAQLRIDAMCGIAPL
ncbi:MAG: tetratricopeptide repeat protein, partial [candidate division Zixibacteria bacterium]|nr:tetratricopeptide repeat protein [candidate division Zixibacteria bacterium]